MMSGAKSQKPRCACTGVVLWLIDPPQYEHKREAQASRYANVGKDCESAKHEAIRNASDVRIVCYALTITIQHYNRKSKQKSCINKSKI